MSVADGFDAAPASGEPPEKGRLVNGRFRPGDERLVHRGAVVEFYEVEVADRDGAPFQRDVVRHPGAVSVVPLDGDEIVLVRQYRAALDADLLELPAGKRDVDGEPPIETAQRELVEEVGLRAGTIEPLINLHHSPGFCDEYGHIFVATELVAVATERSGPEEDAMTIHRFTVSEAVERCFDGTITDAKTVVGILAVANRFLRS